MLAELMTSILPCMSRDVKVYIQGFDHTAAPERKIAHGMELYMYVALVEVDGDLGTQSIKAVIRVWITRRQRWRINQ